MGGRRPPGAATVFPLLAGDLATGRRARHDSPSQNSVAQKNNPGAKEEHQRFPGDQYSGGTALARCRAVDRCDQTKAGKEGTGQGGHEYYGRKQEKLRLLLILPSVLPPARSLAKSRRWEAESFRL